MKPETGEWIAKAANDLATAQHEIALEETLKCDAVCFYAQQCAEKYLKSICG